MIMFTHKRLRTRRDKVNDRFETIEARMYNIEMRIAQLERSALKDGRLCEDCKARAEAWGVYADCLTCQAQTGDE